MNLKKLAFKGLFWNSLGTIGAGFINLLVTMVLARILTPEDFGVIAILAVFSTISETIIDSGFSQAIIRDNKTDNVALTSVFYLNIFIATFIYIILFILSPFIAAFYKNNDLIKLSRVIFSSIVFSSFGLIQNALYQKDVNFRSPAISAIVSMIIAGILAVALALSGGGVWSLVGNVVCFTFLKSLLLWFQSSWRPKGFIVISSLTEYFHFGRNLLVQGFMDRIITNLEPLLIGRFYTADSLGFYSQSGKINTYISATSSSVLQRVTYPILTKLSDTIPHLRDSFRRIVSWVVFCLVPLYTIILIAPEDVMVILFGEQWRAAGVYLRLWSISGLALSIYTLFTNIFLVLGLSGYYLKLFTIKQIIKIIAVISTITISIKAVMLAVVGTTVLTGVIYIVTSARLLEYRLQDLLSDISLPFLIAIISGAVALYIKGLFDNLGSFANLACTSLIVFTIYLLLMSLTNNKILNEIKIALRARTSH